MCSRHGQRQRGRGGSAYVWLIVLIALTLVPIAAHAQVQLLNPNWNITLTDAGYSDWLYDNTPGYQGREYLSGEWGAAVSYTRGSGTGGGSATAVAPTWLQPQFLYPDWTTNSNFATVNPITVTAQKLGMDAVATSTIANPDLRIDIAYEMTDTITGMRLGTSPALPATSGSRVDSNRYVLQQTYTITNVSGGDISGLNLFQFLHSLNGVESLYDNRDYAGALGAYRYDTTQIAIDTSYATTPPVAVDVTVAGPVHVTSGPPEPPPGPPPPPGTLLDYIGFASKQEPAAYENGRYGVEGVDDHVTGKPSVGVHHSVESGLLSNVNDFASADPNTAHWVGGAQQYQLGSLAPGQSVSFDLMLGIKTGTVVDTTGTCGGSANGGSGHAGGVDFSFEKVTEIGNFFAEYSIPDEFEIQTRIDEGEFSAFTFAAAGTVQLYEVEYDGTFDGDLTLVFGYDASLLPPGFDPLDLRMYHYYSGAWHDLAGTVDPVAQTITITTDRLSPFAVGTVPEPAAAGALLLLSAAFAARRARS